MRRARLVAPALVAALLCACSLPQGPAEPDRYFVLEAPAGAAAQVPVELAPTSAPSFYDTQRMVYSRAPGTRAYYQFNHWTEKPPRIVHAALRSRFAPAERPRLVLATRLEEMYHDAAARPGSARIRLSARLTDAASHRVVARRVFTVSAPAASYDAPGAVRGFARALGELLDEVVAWVDAEAAK